MRSLLEVLKEVREKIHNFQDELRQNEALTRYAIIDPVLRELGWNLENPKLVRPEFPTSSGRPDYALMHEERPLIMIEAKALDSGLEEAQKKGFEYCWRNKVPYYIITDGNIWRLWDMREMGGRELFSINLRRDPLGKAARELLAIWQPAMPDVHPVLEAIVRYEKPSEVVASKQVNRITIYKLFQKIRRKKGRKLPPRKIYLPNGVSKEIKSWKDLLLAVVESLYDDLERLTPIKSRKGNPKIARSSSQMREPRKLKDLWVETHYSAKGCLRAAIQLLKRVGRSPEEYLIEY